MLCYLVVIYLISLSFTEFWNEDKRINNEAIITVGMMMCGRKRNHQANLRLAANYRVYIEELDFMLWNVANNMPNL